MTQACFGYSREMTAEDHVREIVVGLRARAELDWSLEHAGLHLLEAGRAQALRGDLGRSELPRPIPSLEIGSERLLGHQLTQTRADARDVEARAALCHEPSTRLQRGEYRAEQARMIVDPVKGRVTERQVRDTHEI